MNNFYTYLHIKLTTGEPFYIGKGTLYRFSSLYNRNNYWNNIVKKHGFDTIILDENLSEKEALNKEIYWINRIGRKDLGLGPLVNMTNGGDGQLGNKFTLEHRKKLSLAHKGKILSAETKQKMSKSRKGKKCNRTKQGQLNISLAVSKKLKGKKLSKEHIEKISIKHKGKKLSKEHIEKLTGRSKSIFSVMQFTKDGNYIKTFNNHHDAALEVNGNANDLLYVCKGIVNSHRNFHWKFA